MHFYVLLVIYIFIFFEQRSSPFLAIVSSLLSVLFPSFEDEENLCHVICQLSTDCTLKNCDLRDSTRVERKGGEEKGVDATV